MAAAPQLATRRDVASHSLYRPRMFIGVEPQSDLLRLINITPFELNHASIYCTGSKSDLLPYNV